MTVTAATHFKHRLCLCGLGSSAQLLVHIESLSASSQLQQPCRPGQQYGTPHEHVDSHSEHQAHCPVLTPPLILTLHALRVCVCPLLDRAAFCSLFMSPQLDPILSLLGLSQKKFCSPRGGRKNRKLLSLITTSETLRATDYSSQREENQDLNVHSEVSPIKNSQICQGLL